MKKIYWLMLSAIALLPLVSAVDHPAGFDLYYLLVENVFGGWVYATLGMMAFFMLLGMLSRIPFSTMFLVLGLFLMASLIGFMGTLAVFLFGLIAVFYFLSGLVKWIMGWNT